MSQELENRMFISAKVLRGDEEKASLSEQLAQLKSMYRPYVLAKTPTGSYAKKYLAPTVEISATKLERNRRLQVGKVRFEDFCGCDRGKDEEPQRKHGLFGNFKLRDSDELVTTAQAGGAQVPRIFHRSQMLSYLDGVNVGRVMKKQRKLPRRNHKRFHLNQTEQQMNAVIHSFPMFQHEDQ